MATSTRIATVDAHSAAMTSDAALWDAIRPRSVHGTNSAVACVAEGLVLMIENLPRTARPVPAPRCRMNAASACPARDGARLIDHESPDRQGELRERRTGTSAAS